MSPAPTRITLGQPAGSPSSSEPVFLVVGKIRRPHGVRGEVLVEVYTDFPERLQAGVIVYVGEEVRQHEIISRRSHREGLLLRFAGYTTPEAAGELRNQYVYVRADDRPPLEDGEYYHHQILGMFVHDEHRGFLGRVTEILTTGANDVLVITDEQGKECLIPFADDWIQEVDVPRRTLRVTLLPE
ncbi:MAG: ribosome maturation factor RimM [Anaerolineales bacterium]|nr:ribosome maturation factor RimM [Anaerolineales bacterium]MDW8445742.1 ribosome maturation factor RimM [Anaerolineales bacterium]